MARPTNVLAVVLLASASVGAQGITPAADSLKGDLASVVRALQQVPQTRGQIADARKKVQVIFLPGIPGSKLTVDHEVIWGQDKARAAKLALGDPMSGPFATAEVLSAYDIYGVKKSDVYGQALENINAIASAAHGGLVAIGYDWRQDVGRLAEYLNDQLKKLDPDNDRQFILVGHSFGGVVAWAWQQKYGADNPRVRHLILLGSPLKGSCEIARTLLEGFQGAIPREKPDAKWLALDWMQRLFRNILTGELRSAAFTFPSTFQILPRFLDGEPLATKLDRGCLITTTSNGTDIPTDFLAPAFWRTTAGRAVIGDAWKQIGDPDLEVFLTRLDKVLQMAKDFRLDLTHSNLPVTYFYSSDYPTTQKVLLPNARVGRDEAVLLPALGDGRVPFGTILDACGNGLMRSIRVTEKHGDLPKSKPFEEEIQSLLPAVADFAAIDRVFKQDLAGAVRVLQLDPASTAALRNPGFVSGARDLIRPSENFMAVVQRIRD